jgi:hypothetical protein
LLTNSKRNRWLTAPTDTEPSNPQPSNPDARGHPHSLW